MKKGSLDEIMRMIEMEAVRGIENEMEEGVSSNCKRLMYKGVSSLIRLETVRRNADGSPTLIEST